MQRKRKPLSQLTLEDQQHVQEKRKKSSDECRSLSQPIQARAGTVARMVLKNFMCHSYLEVTFNQNINYVIGRNGSGKSAILTALVVGLGGKASFTNRGNSIKGFIKAGKTSGSVEVVLRNEGPMAYRYTDYGNEITILRNFAASGSSTYKIKSVTGGVISTQAKEIQRVCISLNIQIDNPVCLLNQDTSRNFLNTKDPRQKFLLFMRATRLETLFEEYRKMFNNKKEATRMIREKEVLYEELRNDLKVLKKKMSDQKSILTLKEKVAALQTEILWAKVRDAELDGHSQQRAVTKLAEEHSTIQNQITNETKTSEGYAQSISDLEQQIINLQRSVDEQNDPQNSLVRTLGELKETLNVKTREKRVILKEIAVKTGNCNILEQEIKKITENFDQIEEERAKRMEEIASTEEKIKGIEGLLETSSNDQYQMRNSVSRLQEEEHSLLSEIRQIELQTENTMSRLNGFKGNSNNVLSVYGRDMPRIVEAIKVAKDKFTHMPRGPLGSYITLKDKKWAVAVEGFLSPTLLRAFAVDNKKDNELLMSIFRRVCTSGSKPMVITGKFFFEVHDVRPNIVKPVDECVSVFSALEILDPVVANCLIDQASLESVLLISDNNKAIALMSNQSRVPRNCRQGITMKGDKYYPDPNYKTYASRYHNAQFLQVSTADMIRQMEKNLSSLADKKQTVQNQYQSVKKDFSEQNENAKALDVKVTKLSRALLHLKRTLGDLQNVDEPDVANVVMLQKELADLQQTVVQRNEIQQKIASDLEELKQKVEKKEEKLERIKHIVRGYEDRIDPLNAQISEKQAKRKEFEVNRRFASNRLQECSRRLQSATNELKEKTTVVEQRTRDAVVLGARPVNLRQVPAIVKELTDNERIIRQIESNMESAEVIRKKFENCKEKNIQAADFMKNMHDDVRQLHTAVEKCNQYYKHTEDYFVTFIKHSFQKVLELRQFQGSLEIDMSDKKLDLVVIPQQGSQGFTTTSNLSGGERSFSTVAFLYSLWQCMEFPFYFLDEFDVFMDKVNRTKVMEILLYHAKKSSDLQFVFLTPQDVSSVNDKAVAIHKLADPERGPVITE